MSNVNITLKLYASLTEFLPEMAKTNQIEIHVLDGTSVADILLTYRIPSERAHLVLINGVYILPEDRNTKCLKENDVLALWPPVAGG